MAQTITYGVRFAPSMVKELRETAREMAVELGSDCHWHDVLRAAAERAVRAHRRRKTAASHEQEDVHAGR